MNIGKGGHAVAKSVVGTAGKIGGGALDTVGAAGSGLAGMAKGLVTGDLGKMGDGLKQATVGTVQEAAGTVKDGTMHAVDGVVQAGDHVSGGAQGDAWRSGQAKRWEEAEASATSYVEQ